jgi:hypothetical protein
MIRAEVRRVVPDNGRNGWMTLEFALKEPAHLFAIPLAGMTERGIE